MTACSLDDAVPSDWPFTPGPEWYRELAGADLTEVTSHAAQVPA